MEINPSLWGKYRHSLGKWQSKFMYVIYLILHMKRRIWQKDARLGAAKITAAI